jgi:hypothetical protein
MTKKTHKQKNGSEWSWEETPEVKTALEQFKGNYSGPLYAPHPDLKKEQE